MRKRLSLAGVLLLGGALFLGAPRALRADDGFTVCWWNVENFGVADRFIDGRHVFSAMKPAAEINAVVAILRKIHPDILGVAEIIRDPQDRNLKLLREVLRQGGLDYQGMATVQGYDARIQVALFSRFPISSAQELNKDRFPVTIVDQESGARREARFLVNRGFVEAEVEVAPGYRLGVLLAHLKSKKKEGKADMAILGEEPGETGEDVVRRKEAEMLRGHVDAFLAHHPGEDLLVMGDLNDLPASRPLRSLVGSGPLWALPLADWAGETWTEVVYPKMGREQIDYMLVNPLLRQRFDGSLKVSYLYRSRPEEGPGLDSLTASDHRPLVARFRLGPVAASAPSASGGP